MVQSSDRATPSKFIRNPRFRQDKRRVSTNQSPDMEKWKMGTNVYEMYLAFHQGRLENDPSDGWYKGEMGFFDFYIIPLAKKLFTCGVFGVSSNEFLNYAMINRNEWEQKGEAMVEQYKTNFAEK